MTNMPSSREAQPIIICGFPRSGTSFLQALLNSHPDIHISTESRGRILLATRLLCSQVAVVHRRKTERWRGLEPDEACVRVLRAMWYYIEPEQYFARRFGNKTPGNERFFSFYESVFRKDPPLYLYPIRDPAAVLASYINAPWAGTPGLWQLAWRLWRSMRAARRFRECHPERLLFVPLDRADTRQQREALVSSVFRHVKEEQTASVERFCDQWPRINASRTMASDSHHKLMNRISQHPPVRFLRRSFGYE